MKKNNFVKIFNDDSLEFIENLICEGFVFDHIITDPPYKISKSNNLDTLRNRRGINFGDWDNKFDLLAWIPKYIKLLKKNGSIIIFCSYLNISNIAEILSENNMIVKDIIVWQKSNPMPRNTKRRYVQDMEFAIWAVRKNSKWTFNKPNDQPYLRSLFKFPIVSGKEKTIHPTQKSLKLMKEIISIHTNKNDIILDPFMGSGTTGVACVNLERNFVGIEKNKKYYKIAKERLNV